MRLIDADEHKGKTICSHTYSGVKKLINIDDVPTAYDIDGVVDDLEYYRKDVPEDKDYYSWVSAIDRAIETVKQGGVSDDVCEWKKRKEDWESSCDYLIEEKWFPAIFEATIDEYYCPYCGKKIKAVEYE